MGHQYRIINTDGHIIEPPHLWEKYLPKRFADKAPRLVKDEEGGDAWELIPGSKPMPIGLVTNQGEWGKRYEELKWLGSTYDNIRKGAFDGRERLLEMDIDGVDAEVIFPSQRTMGVFMAQPDDQLHVAGLEAYNTWLFEEFSAPDRNRILPLVQVPAVGCDTAIATIREAKNAGFRGAIINAFPSGGDQLSREDDPFWKVAEEEQFPIHIHLSLNLAGKRRMSASDAGKFSNAGVGNMLVLAGGTIGAPSTFIAQFVYDGVFDRFPGLQMVLAEGGAGWVPHFMEHMDDHWWRNRVDAKSALKMTPSDYVRQNWKFTFIREPFAVANRHWIGVRNLMWSSDYPHHRHDWPYSRRIIADTMAGVPEAEKQLMICDNAVDLYRLG